MNAAALLFVVLASLDPGSRAAAKESYQTAKREYQLGNYVHAANRFSELYRETGDPILLFNAAQAWRLAGGREKEAIAAYKGYLREVPDARNASVVRAHIRQLRTASFRPARRDKGLLEPRQQSSPKVLAVEQQPSPVPKRPIYKRWWFWAGVGAVVVGSAVVVASSGSSSGAPSTSLGHQPIFR